MVDFLIIRNKCDLATEYTNWIGDGMKAYLEGKGHSVTDLSDANASPANVTAWLKYGSMKTCKAIIALDHGSSGIFWGEKYGKIAQVINLANAEELTKKLHVYTLACSTNAVNGLGQTAVQKGCYSWLGYKVPVYAMKSQSFKDCIWSYMKAMAEGKTMEQCEEALKQAYLARKNQSFVYQYNLDRMLLRKAGNNMTVNSHNRCAEKGSGYAQYLLVDYSFTSSIRYLWAYAGNRWRYKRITDAEVAGIAKLLMEATKVLVWWEGNKLLFVRARK